MRNVTKELTYDRAPCLGTDGNGKLLLNAPGWTGVSAIQSTIIRVIAPSLIRLEWQLELSQQPHLKFLPGCALI